MNPGLILFSENSGKTPPRPASSAGPAPASDQGRRRILVVDDQRLIADTLAEILNEAGFAAAAAYDAWEALEIASRFQPDWLLSDVLMPHMNGVALAIEIRKRHPSTAILLLSGQAGIGEILQEAHAQGYHFELLAKPIHPRELLDRLKQP